MACIVLGTGNRCIICEGKRPKRGNVVNKCEKNGTWEQYTKSFDMHAPKHPRYITPLLLPQMGVGP